MHRHGRMYGRKSLRVSAALTKNIKKSKRWNVKVLEQHTHLRRDARGRADEPVLGPHPHARRLEERNEQVEKRRRLRLGN